jgi:3-deoxy-D-manno-octulosonic-acid transferase
MLRYYNILSYCLAPLVPWWLKLRALRGKEERGRIAERFGISSYGRPQGMLLWIHAASVGEANSVLTLIHQLRTRFPTVHILLTTGTVTSTALMKQRLPAGVIHQYAPVDTPQATERFIRHWLPDIAWFVESELWPNLVCTARHYFCLMALINARMSTRSFTFWKKHPAAAREMLAGFRIAFAQSEDDASRLRALGIRDVTVNGNLKYDAPVLSCNESELIKMQQMLAGRPIWLAASTHPGEEILIAKAHAMLAKNHPNLLTIIVPRHPDRGTHIARELAAFGQVVQRSTKTPVHKNTAFYIADTLGELGLFYRLSEIVFMGGSLVAHGGQNPLEPAQLACAIIAGTHTHNFADMYREMYTTDAARQIQDTTQLATLVNLLFTNTHMRTDMQNRAKHFVQSRSGASTAIIDLFSPIFTP